MILLYKMLPCKLYILKAKASLQSKEIQCPATLLTLVVFFTFCTFFTSYNLDLKKLYLEFYVTDLHKIAYNVLKCIYK